MAMNKLAGVSGELRASKIRQGVISFFANLLRYAFLIAFSYILLYPLIYLITHSFRAPIDVTDPTILWVPKNLSMEPVKEAIEYLKLEESAWNTFILELVSAVMATITCGIAAYGMARFNFKGRKILNFILILSILVPSVIIIIPNYINFYDFNPLGIVSLIELFGVEFPKGSTSLLNTVWAFWLPALTATGIRAGFYIYIYMQFYKGLPKELEEAAWVDGCGPWKTYLRIVVPSSGTSILTVSMLAIIWHWNDYYNALMFHSDYTMAVELNMILQKSLRTSRTLETDGPLAACLIFLLPVLIMYLILQKKFISSIASTGIVG